VDLTYRLVRGFIDEHYVKRYTLQNGYIPVKKEKKVFTISGASPASVENPASVILLKSLVEQQESLALKFWFFFLSESHWQLLLDYWQLRMNNANFEVQTKESSFEARIYGVGYASDDRRKSQDDVSDLLSSVDFTLRPAPARQRTKSFQKTF